MEHREVYTVETETRTTTHHWQKDSEGFLISVHETPSGAQLRCRVCRLGPDGKTIFFFDKAVKEEQALTLDDLLAMWLT